MFMDGMYSSLLVKSGLLPAWPHAGFHDCLLGFFQDLRDLKQNVWNV
jgi:hypothetical protein